MGYRTDERTWTVKSSSDRKKVTAEQMFTLKAMGCDIVQGYYFSKPVTEEEFEETISLIQKVRYDSLFTFILNLLA